jgi:hypothetical protein
MSTLFGVPVEGRVGPASFEPHLERIHVNADLLVEWKAYLTDCLENNFAVVAQIDVASDGGTVLWVPLPFKRESEDTATTTIRHELLQEFARECLGDFIKRRRSAR